MGGDWRSNLVTLFVDNIPSRVDWKWLSRIFARHGKVRDVFIPASLRRRSQKKFGFVRFGSVEEARTLVDQLDGVWLLDPRLVVKEAAHGWNQRGFQFADHNLYPCRRCLEEESGTSQRRETTAKNFKDLGSYVDVAKMGVSLPAEAQTGKDVGKKEVVTSPECNVSCQAPVVSVTVEEDELSWLKCSAVGIVHDIKVTPSLQDVLISEGFIYCHLRSMGRKMTLLSFDTQEKMLILLEEGKDLLQNWFSSITPWEPHLLNHHRFVWLCCEGIPLHGWTVDVFRGIGSIWGEHISVDDLTSRKRRLDKAFVLIFTTFKEYIQ